MNTAIRIPSQEEAALAKLCSQELAGVLASKGDEQCFSFKDDSGQTHDITLPRSALNLFVEVLTQLGGGNIAQITPVHAELTAQRAADMLNMSRSTLIKLLDEGVIPFARKGNRRKVAYIDVMKYKETLLNKRLASLEELTALDQENKMGY